MAKPIVLHLVHGTWGRGLGRHIREGLDNFPMTRMIGSWLRLGEQQDTLWHEQNSDFQKGVAKAMVGLLSDKEVEITFRSFSWSGSNSFHARQKAAKQFRGYLLDALTTEPEADHFVVAHSHGGNVAVAAVIEGFDVGVGRLAGIITLATPFLSLGVEEHSTLKMLTYAMLPVWIALVAGALVITLLFSGYTYLLCWLTSMAVGLYGSIFLCPRLARENSTDSNRFLLSVTYLLLIVCWAGVYWGGFHGAKGWVAVSHSADSIFGVWERLSPWFLGNLVGLLSLLFLLVARAAGVHDKKHNHLVLADSVMDIGVLLLTVVVGVFSFEAARSTNQILSWYVVFLIFLPFVSLFAAVSLEKYFPLIFKRGEAIWRLDFLSRDLHCLPCPLIAFRLPGDEAALAIGAAQVMRAVPSFFSRVVSRIAEIEHVPRGIVAAIVALAITVFLSGVVAVQASGIGSGWLFWLIGGVISLGGIGLLLFAVAMMLATGLVAVSLISFLFLALAVGPGVLRWMPAIRVDCEPLPRCRNVNACRLSIPWEAMVEYKDKGMRHGLYELHSVQEVVAGEVAKMCR